MDAVFVLTDCLTSLHVVGVCVFVVRVLTRFRAVHEEVVKLDHDFGVTFSGVLTDDEGRVRALWGSYAEQVSKGGQRPVFSDMLSLPAQPGRASSVASASTTQKQPVCLLRGATQQQMQATSNNTPSVCRRPAVALCALG